MRIVEIGVFLVGGHIARGHRIRGLEHLAVGHQQRARAIGQKQALVRVERERIGLRQPGEQGPQLRAHVKERAVRAIDVVP